MAATEADAVGALEDAAAAAVQALSAASMTVSNLAERLPVIAVTIVSGRDRRKILLRMSSVVAFTRSLCSSCPNLTGRSLPMLLVGEEGV